MMRTRFRANSIALTVIVIMAAAYAVTEHVIMAREIETRSASSDVRDLRTDLIMIRLDVIELKSPADDALVDLIERFERLEHTLPSEYQGAVHDARQQIEQLRRRSRVSDSARTDP